MTESDSICFWGLLYLPWKPLAFFEKALKIDSLTNWVFILLDFKITEKEILQSISKLKHGNSFGLDGIKNELFKCSQTYLVSCITKHFNNILSTGQYPKKWKTGYIKPIFKGDDPLNYRGIPIMPCLSKIFYCILNNRLQKFFDDKVINESQIGFQPKARTSDHMFILRTLIEKYQSVNCMHALLILKKPLTQCCIV